MNDILTIVKIMVTVPTLVLETILKGITCILVVFSIIIIAILFPIFKHVWSNLEDSWLFKYASTWSGNYPITKAVFELWS